MRSCWLALLACIAAAIPAAAQHQSKGAQSYASLFSPEFGVEGSVVGGLVDDPDRAREIENVNRISVAEAGVAMRNYVDPYFQFDLEISGGEGFEGETRSSEFGVEVAYITYLRDANGIWARIGKQPTSFGEYNDEEPDEAPVVTAPDVIIAFFGEDDGYIDTGVEINWNFELFDTSHILWLGVLNGDNPVAFHDGVEQKPVYFARYETFFDFGDLTGLEFGISYLQGLNRRNVMIEDDEAESGAESERVTVRGVTQMANVHLELNHQDAMHYLYSGFSVTGELFWQNREYERNDAVDSAAAEEGIAKSDLELDESVMGWYVLAAMKLDRNWGISARVQQSPVLAVELGEDEGDDAAEEENGEESEAGPYTIYGDDKIDGYSLILSYSTSRFTTMRAEYTHKRLGDESWNELWFQLQVLIGFERPDVF